MKHARADYDRIQDPASKIPEDEPVFLFRGQDILAPIVLEFYAQKVEELGGQREVIDLTRAHANRMREWHHRKMPDIG